MIDGNVGEKKKTELFNRKTSLTLSSALPHKIPVDSLHEISFIKFVDCLHIIEKSPSSWLFRYFSFWKKDSNHDTKKTERWLRWFYWRHKERERARQKIIMSFSSLLSIPIENICQCYSLRQFFPITNVSS